MEYFSVGSQFRVDWDLRTDSVKCVAVCEKWFCLFTKINAVELKDKGWILRDGSISWVHSCRRCYFIVIVSWLLLFQFCLRNFSRISLTSNFQKSAYWFGVFIEQANFTFYDAFSKLPNWFDSCQRFIYWPRFIYHQRKLSPPSTAGDEFFLTMPFIYDQDDSQFFFIEERDQSMVVEFCCLYCYYYNYSSINHVLGCNHFYHSLSHTTDQ